MGTTINVVKNKKPVKAMKRGLATPKVLRNNTQKSNENSGQVQSGASK